MNPSNEWAEAQVEKFDAVSEQGYSAMESFLRQALKEAMLVGADAVTVEKLKLDEGQASFQNWIGTGWTAAREEQLRKRAEIVGNKG